MGYHSAMGTEAKQPFRRDDDFIRATNAALDGVQTLSSESDRGCVLVGAAMLDEVLRGILLGPLRDDEETLRALFDAGSAPLSSFSAKIRLCYALGLVSKNTHADLHRVREIRNDAAHFEKRRGAGFDTGFATQSVVDRCRAFRLLPAEITQTWPPRAIFEMAVGLMASVLGEYALAQKFVALNTSRAFACPMGNDLADGRDDSVFRTVGLETARKAAETLGQKPPGVPTPTEE